MAAKKGLMVLGIGAALVGLLLLFRKKKPALPEAPEDGVLVALLNPPSEATMWQLIIYDWDELNHISKFGLGIKDSATFDIPSGWVFPLRVDILIYGDSTVYYRMHSTENAFPEFYREAFIPDYGSYYFNVAKEQFEKA